MSKITIIPPSLEDGLIESGDTERLRIEVRDDAGTLVDPATLTLTVAPPGGVIVVKAWPTDAEIVRDSAGVFHRDLPLSVEGVWAYQWASTVPTKVEGGRVSVSPAPVDSLPASLSVEALKRRVDVTGDRDDDLLADDLAAAFELAQAAPPYGTGRVLIPDPRLASDDPVVRTVMSTRRRVRVPDAREITGVTVDGTATTYAPLMIDGLVVQVDLADDGQWADSPRRGYYTSATYSLDERTPTSRTVAITGRFGFAALPDDLAFAIYVLAARWSYERLAQYADQVAILEGGAVQSYYRQLPPRVKLAFSRYALPPALGGLR